MLEAVYSSQGRRLPPIETASTTKEARRVLEWQQEVARSTAASDAHSSVASHEYRIQRPPPASYQRADSYPPLRQERPMRLVRRETVMTEHYRSDRDHQEGGRGGNGSGFSGTKLVGTLLGAAAGAAVAYAMVRSESPPRRPPLPRRSSYGDQGPSYVHPRPVEMRPAERAPARSYVSARDPAERPRWVEYVIAAPQPPRVHDLTRIEERSHVSLRSGRSSGHSSRARSRSEVGSSRYDRPLANSPPRRARSPPATSHVSYRSRHNPRLGGDGRSYHSKRDDDMGSYVSLRSPRTASTVKQRFPLEHISTSPSKISTTTIRVVPKDERRSEVSARHISLPRSAVSGVGYASSIAPSDSVSSIGSKWERERLRDRMRERW